MGIKNVLREIFGRNDDDNLLNQINGFITNIYSSVSIDTTKSNYDLTKSVYFTSDYGIGETELKKIQIGATFGKPIVKSALAFAYSGDYKINHEDETTEEKINTFLKENASILKDWQRYSFRDGDSYLRINEDSTLEIIPAKDVEIHTEEFNINNIIGYDIKTVVKKKESTQTITYIEELRKVSPFRRVIKFSESEAEGVELTEYSRTGTGEQPLPLIPLEHNKEPRTLRGISDFQNIYQLMIEYTKIFNNGENNFIYNTLNIPVFKGMKDVRRFIQNNFSKGADGKYKLNWNERKVIVGGEGLDATILSGMQMAGECQILLNITFWLICQASETPEFLFGTAVQSSKASVSEQMPIVVKKAESNQLEFKDALGVLIDTYIFIEGQTDLSLVEGDYTIIAPKILDEDRKLNLEIIKILKAEGLLSDKTALILAGIDIYVEDLDKELEEARKEDEEKNNASDPFQNNPQAQADEIARQEQAKLDAESALKVKEQKMTTKVNEMFEKVKLDKDFIENEKTKISETKQILKDKQIKLDNEIKEAERLVKKLKK